MSCTATVINTSSQDLRKVRRTNSADSSFPTRIPQKALPDAFFLPPYPAASATLQEVIRTRGDSGAVAANLLMLVPYAVASDTNTFNVRVVAWHAVGQPNNDPNKNLYVPTPICTLACTVSTPTGLAGTQVLNTELFCDTIAITDGDASLVKVYSPANDTIAWAVIDFLGAPYVEVLFDTVTGTTSMNALYKTF